jgi:hypothetical protein
MEKMFLYEEALFARCDTTGELSATIGTYCTFDLEYLVGH